jgi:hypothetical protein
VSDKLLAEERIIIIIIIIIRNGANTISLQTLFGDLINAMNSNGIPLCRK